MSAWVVTMGAGATMGSCIRRLPFHPKERLGPQSITWASEMAKHNSGVTTRPLCSIHIADPIERLVIPLAPTTQHHHWPIGIPRDLHLLEFDEGPWLATCAQGIQAKGLAFPRRHGALGRAARIVPARLMECLL